VPANWKRLTFGGVTLRVPPTMPVTHLAANYLSPGECSAAAFPTSGAFLGNGDPGPTSCPMIPAGFVPVPTDGVWMHTPEVMDFPSPEVPAPPLRVLTIGGLRVAIADATVNVAPGLKSAIDLTISGRDGEQLPAAIRIGLGPDPNVARTILYSIAPAN
jgi:hypothetical protein